MREAFANCSSLTSIIINATAATIDGWAFMNATQSADECEIEKIQRIAYNVGMAFQIQDDILDETATFEELGKAIHSDEKNGKVTYVTIHGIEQSKKEVERLSNEAIMLLQSIDGESQFLEELITYLINRKN